jgi:dephospho-CoA kinase
MPVKIGLTGGIGTGKSTVAGILADCGAEVVVGDELGRQAIDFQPEVREAIRKRFGESIFDSKGKLNRKQLGELVFADSSHVRWLTELTFPYIYHEWQQAVSECRVAMIVFDAALIFEWGIQKDFDKVVVVTTRSELAVKRAESGRFSEKTVLQRQRYQLPVERKIAEADEVIENSATIGDLKRKVESLYDKWLDL